jgi:mono/diheme cytochrome c family protein
MRELAIILACVVAVWSRPQVAPRSVWDGVYTEEQAKRGEGLYQKKCASCHGEKLTGGAAPPLAGDWFVSNWSGLTLDFLFERIRVTMPSAGPSKVSVSEKADILAYLLHVNKFPPGKTELQDKAEMMKDILIERDQPQDHAGKSRQ